MADIVAILEFLSAYQDLLVAGTLLYPALRLREYAAPQHFDPNDPTYLPPYLRSRAYEGD